MEIKPGEKIYKRTADSDVFIEWRLVSAKISKKNVEAKISWLDTKIKGNPNKVEYPQTATKGQKAAIDYYNKTHRGPVEKLEAEKQRYENLLAILEGLPISTGGAHG
jgi:hypothetical protein